MLVELKGVVVEVVLLYDVKEVDGSMLLVEDV